MIKNIYVLLGLPEGSSLSEIKEAYSKLIKSLNVSKNCCECDFKQKAQVAEENLEISWQHISNANDESTHKIEVHRNNYDQTQDYCQPKLGQLLVASGIITFEELESFLDIQRNTKTEHIPLGQLFIAARYLTDDQLNYYLHLQKILKLPSDHPERWGQRLLELGLINDDQLKVALIEQKTKGCTLREALINNNLLTTEILDRIF